MNPLAEALRAFAERLGDGSAPAVEIVVDGTPVTLSGPAARALVEALHTYHDPDDRGRCDRCGGRLDDNFLCAGCGTPNGVFGQLIRERAERYTGPPSLNG